MVAAPGEARDGDDQRARGAAARGRPDGRGAWYRGYLQPAGLLDGPLKVTPDRGRYFWQGSHPKDAFVRIEIGRTSGKVDEVSLSVPLRAGWG